MRLAGKTIIVTGAGSGIGRAATHRFVEEGANVVAVDVSDDGLAATTDGIDRVSTVVGSVSEVDTWDRAVAAAELVGGLDGAYLNAGLYGFSGPIDEHPLDQYQAMIDTNITGVVLGVRRCVPELRSRGGGALVATASVAGIVAFEGNPVYTLTKQAVAGYVRAVAASLSGDRITINAVCPGVVDTPMTVRASRTGTIDPDGIEMITPERVAATALDLLTTNLTGVCRAVRERGEPVDWQFPTWSELARA
jgi:NAD(P)-dependent dehydrogenase (short-subunit alcohol dehydrogenase family)